MKKKWVGKSISIIVSAALLAPIFFVILGSFISVDIKVAQTNQYHNLDFTLGQYFTLIVQDSNYFNNLMNTFWILICSVVPQIILALGCAYYLSYSNGRNSRWLYKLNVILMLLPFQLIFIPYLFVIAVIGSLGQVNLTDHMLSVIAPSLLSPFATFFLTQFMKSLPIEQVEAARIDGASDWIILRKVILPQINHVVAAVAFVSTIDIWAMLIQPLLLFTDLKKMPLALYLEAMFANKSTSYYAGAVIYLLIPIIIFIKLYHIIRKKQLSDEALKGVVEDEGTI